MKVLGSGKQLYFSSAEDLVLSYNNWKRLWVSEWDISSVVSYLIDTGASLW